MQKHSTKTTKTIKRTPRKLTIQQAAEQVKDRQQLAEAISTVLRSPLTAPQLYQPVADFVTEISSALLDNSPEMIEKALALGMCGGMCPGTRDGSVCPGPEAHPPDALDAKAQEEGSHVN